MLVSTNSPNTKKKDREICVITDGTIGMRHQALAIGEALATDKRLETCNVREIIFIPPMLIRYFPRILSIIPIKLVELIISLSNYASSNIIGKSQNADIIITCGRRMAGVSIALRRITGAHGQPTKSIHIQDPRLPLDLFDVVVAPIHDKIRGPNVVTSIGSISGLNEEKIQTEGKKLAPKWTKIKRPLYAVLLGGDNRRYKISQRMVDLMAKRLSDFATTNDVSLALIPSRRTPSGVLKSLTLKLQKTNYVTFKDGDKNPYPGILRYTDGVIVTSDSVNMASEAAISGQPILIAEWRRETGRIAAFHSAMMKAGHSANLTETIPKRKFQRLFELPEITNKIFHNLGKKTELKNKRQKVVQ